MIDCILSACNENPNYLCFIPNFINSFKLVFPNTRVLIVMIMKEENLPEELNVYKNNFIFFEPIEGIKTAYIGQVIRILYPSLVNSSSCLIQDIDAICISQEWYTSGYLLEEMKTKFITARPMKPGIVDENQIAITWNGASSEIWQQINKCHSVEDVRQTLIDNYPKDYGILNPPPLDWFRKGWFTDQELLFKFVMDSNIPHKVIGDAHLRRIDKLGMTLEKAHNTDISKFTDIITCREGSKDWDKINNLFIYKLLKMKVGIFIPVDSGYFRHIQGLLYSFKDLLDMPYKVHIIDMGLGENYKNVIKSNFGFIDFTFDKIEIGKKINYEFKIRTLEYARQFNYDIIMMMDAKNHLKKPLSEIEKNLDKVLIHDISPYLEKDWTHDTALKAMGVFDNKEILDSYQYQSNNPVFRVKECVHILNDINHYGLKEECLAPQGSAKSFSGDSRHRQDQSVISVVLKKHGIKPSPHFQYSTYHNTIH